MKLFKLLLICFFIITCGKENKNISDAKKYLTDLGLEIPEGLSDEEILNIAKEEKDQIEKEKVVFENFREEGREKITTYYENGQIELEENYNKDDKLDGEWIYYYENGLVKIKGNYKDGKRDGNWVWFWESAFRATEGQFKDDKQIGVWTYYYENGDFSYQDNFDIISK